METHPPLPPQILVQSNLKRGWTVRIIFPLMWDLDINGHGPSSARRVKCLFPSPLALCPAWPSDRATGRASAGVAAGSYKRRGDGLHCLAAEQHLQAASRRHPPPCPPPRRQTCSEGASQSRLDSAPLLGSHSSAQASGKTNEQQAKKVKFVVCGLEAAFGGRPQGTNLTPPCRVCLSAWSRVRCPWHPSAREG